MSVFVDPDDHERLVERARLEERSVSAELRVAIREHLHRLPSGDDLRRALRSARRRHFGAPMTVSALVADEEERRRRAKEELRRQQRLHLAESSSWPRIDLADLRFDRHSVEDTSTGERFSVIAARCSMP